ncbi:sushi, nidogen and EGF-like domains 1 [Seminavis robusta]|uniref:Sushi, nidogen and EGF-like domains 1 n=1 Tax=Seminavis robusta TaxID=568900 RepID=A0A9N8ESW9_9STRA|nr:sushi, nidogen and EGF-like domains 1 [Seminavis robusta]|eukprot:Sro1543_g281190.1 sushi, nidogen and EGF-like domains 1 (381) ;mRNA; r:21328-22470
MLTQNLENFLQHQPSNMITSTTLKMAMLRGFLLFALFWTKAEGQAQFQCQTDADCLNNGFCELKISSGERYCRCPSGFGGQDCSATCLRECQNGGSCRYHEDISHGSDQDGDTYCECPETFLGVNCEIPFTLCPDDNLKCLNGGTCVAVTDSPSSFRCDCPGTRTGEVCQYDSPEDPRIPPFQCETNSDCLNNGSCIQDSTQKICQCQDGFGGEDCSETCLQDCQNGGSCRYHKDISHGSDQDGNTLCQCIGNYVGVNCEIPFTSCPGGGIIRCLHGGSCEPRPNGVYGCSCPSPRTGDFCQFDSKDDPRISNGQSHQNHLSIKEDKSVEKALAMALGAIAVAAIATWIAMACLPRSRGDGVDKSWNEREDTVDTDAMTC